MECTMHHLEDPWTKILTEIQMSETQYVLYIIQASLIKGFLCFT